MQVRRHAIGPLDRLFEFMSDQCPVHRFHAISRRVGAQAIIHIFDIGEERRIQGTDRLDDPTMDQQSRAKNDDLIGIIALPPGRLRLDRSFETPGALPDRNARAEIRLRQGRRDRRRWD